MPDQSRFWGGKDSAWDRGDAFVSMIPLRYDFRQVLMLDIDNLCHILALANVCTPSDMKKVPIYRMMLDLPVISLFQDEMNGAFPSENPKHDLLYRGTSGQLETISFRKQKIIFRDNKIIPIHNINSDQPRYEPREFQSDWLVAFQYGDVNNSVAVGAIHRTQLSKKIEAGTHQDTAKFVRNDWEFFKNGSHLRLPYVPDKELNRIFRQSMTALTNAILSQARVFIREQQEDHEEDNRYENYRLLQGLEEL